MKTVYLAVQVPDTKTPAEVLEELDPHTHYTLAAPDNIPLTVLMRNNSDGTRSYLGAFRSPELAADAKNDNIKELEGLYVEDDYDLITSGLDLS